MNHFKPYRDQFRYQTAEDGDVIRVEIDYDKGGMCYATYKQKRRGVYIHISRVTIERGPNCTTERFGLFAGVMFFVKPLARKSDKALAAVAEQWDSLAPELAQLFATNKDSAKARVHALVAEMAGVS